MKEFLRILGVVAAVLVVIALLVYSDSDYDNADTDITKNVEDAVYGTNQTDDDEITGVLRDIMDVVRQRNANDFKNNFELDNSDVYEISSYETREDLMRIMALLEASIGELEKSEVVVKEAQAEMESLIRTNEELTEAERTSALKSFKERINDVDTAVLRRERTETLIDLYQVTLDYYQFLLTEYNDYVIEPNEYNERALAFYTDANIDTANAYLTEIELKSNVFLQADTAMNEYVQSSFDENGVNMQVSDFYNSLY